MTISLPRRRTALTAVIGAVSLVTAGLGVPLTARGAASASDLILSEYVEGSGTTKALEVFNGTDSTVDLDDYSIEVYFNGQSSLGVAASLSGTLAPAGTYVFADTSLADVADQTTGSSLWNGNDAIVLPGAGVVDSFGQIGVDPGSAWF